MEDYEERKSWSVREEDILEELSEMMEITDGEKDLLADLEDVAEKQADAMTDDFYGRLMAHENTAEYFEGLNTDDHDFVAPWFVDLFGGEYGADYVADRLEIGRIHVRIGLPVRYPLSMIDVIMEHGEEVTAQSPEPEKAKDAFQKLLSLDIAIFNQAYESRQLEHLADLVGGERLARRLLTGGASQ
jgi:hypothetical protein